METEDEDEDVLRVGGGIAFCEIVEFNLGGGEVGGKEKRGECVLGLNKTMSSHRYVYILYILYIYIYISESKGSDDPYHPLSTSNLKQNTRACFILLTHPFPSTIRAPKHSVSPNYSTPNPPNTTTT